MWMKNDFFCVVTNGVRKIVLKKNWYVFFCFFYFFIFYYFFLIFFIFKKRRKKTERRRRRKSCFAKKTKKTLENIYALKMFDDICKYIKQYKTDKIKIKLLYDILNEEFFEICKYQEFNELFYPFKVVISCFFSIPILSGLEYDVSGVGLSVQ